MNHYQTLGLQSNATQDEIKTAFRRESMKHHPDRHPNADDVGKKMAENAFLKAKEAYDVLSDPKKRKAYDLDSNQAFKKSPIDEQWQRARKQKSEDFMKDFAKVWAESNFAKEQDPWHDVQKQDAANFKKKFEQNIRQDLNKTISTSIEISMEDAFTGKTVQVTYDQSNLSKRTVEVIIPASIKSGTKLFCKGGGMSLDKSRPPGDMHLTVMINGGNNWSRDNDDLYLATPISSLDLITGGKVIVPTIDGSTLEVGIRPGTSIETKIRIMGRGMYRADKGRGDMFLDLKVFTPKLDMNNSRIAAILDELKYLI
jgi:curved DNA-binding protein